MENTRLKELMALPYNDLLSEKELKSELISIYKEVFGAKACSSCKDKFPQYYQKLNTYLATEKEESLFKLRKDIGVVQINFGSGDFISFDNAPNDICIEFLKANPNRISMFAEYPTNWKELLTNNVSEDENA